MLVIANTFAFNGGTTFLLRFAKEYYIQTNNKIDILLLTKIINDDLEIKIKEYSNIFYLKDFIISGFKSMGNSQLSIFAPLDRSIDKILEQNRNHIHIMGVFGLLFFHRINKNNLYKCSIGAYHQNEYMYNCNYDLYFKKIIKKTFIEINEKNLIFLNETRRLNYSKFFHKHIINANVVPVGINLKENAPKLAKHSIKRIVSIGNLTKYKTYNKHIITLLPKLIKEFNNIYFHYDIYGDGEERKNLEELVEHLSLSNHVTFHGRIEYSKMESILKDTFVFVGNGTSIVEASSYSIPSIIGIESINQPETYGFLSDIVGLSYNEFDNSKKVYPIYDLIRELIINKDYYHEKSIACYKKAKEYSVKKTVKEFLKIDKELQPYHTRYSNILSFFNFIFIGILHKTKLNKCFKNRKDQSDSPIIKI
jgi:1,2-diacylglycerol 3-alpha-glucosyltransferase